MKECFSAKSVPILQFNNLVLSKVVNFTPISPVCVKLLIDPTVGIRFLNIFIVYFKIQID